MENIKLQNYWEVVKLVPGYQHILKLAGFSEKVLDIMTRWDGQELEIIDKIEKEYRIERLKIQEQIREFKKEIKQEFGQEITEYRLDFLKNQKQELENHLKEGYQYNQEMKVKFFNPFQSFEWLRLVIMDLWQLPKYERMLKKIVFEIRLLENRDLVQKNQITPEMIVRAKDYPFENLIKVSQKNFALCPFHNEKTSSLYIKNNFYYCFGCNVSGDTIDFVMKTQNIDFIKAVQLLQ